MFAGYAGVVKPVSGKNAETADERPAKQAPIPLSEVGSRGGISIPFALFPSRDLYVFCVTIARANEFMP
ncbi:hypothetical protein [Rhizobium sp. 18065]|uniref:hypothetical protein n=1 Tax=Rhizobium sp. 18065 TaxID=2681411 RepID=UPI00135821CA|nr:hypothetical protein [Rhizobium sp. 18065]